MRRNGEFALVAGFESRGFELLIYSDGSYNFPRKTPKGVARRLLKAAGNPSESIDSDEASRRTREHGLDWMAH
jgi:hypothetical protein